MSDKSLNHNFYSLYKPQAGFWKILKSFFTTPSIDQHVAHLEKLKGIKITSFHYVPMSDELRVIATYKGYEFKIEMDWGGDINLTSKPDVPENIFNTLVSHMKSYTKISPKEVKEARKRYIEIAKSNRENS